MYCGEIMTFDDTLTLKMASHDVVEHLKNQNYIRWQTIKFIRERFRERKNHNALEKPPNLGFRP